MYTDKMAAPLQNKIDRFLEDLKEYYSKTVRNNPQTVRQIESSLRIISFLVAGRFENGQLISELIYTASNLLVFINDNVFKAAAKAIPKLDISEERVMRVLTVLEYVEVFLEMAAQKKWGKKGAWIVIVIVQILKTALRFVLLFKYEAGIQPTPPVSPADRDLLNDANTEEHDPIEDAFDESVAASAKETTFTLKSSGRQVRKLDSTPTARKWSLPGQGQGQMENRLRDKKRQQMFSPPTKLDKKRMWAEFLHIGRPVAHLLSMYFFGQCSLKPWLIASGMDVSSMMLMGDPETLSSKEKAELRRRSFMLLFYFLRSPFYDQYSKTKIIAFLSFLADHVPLSGIILRPLIAYLPTWQKMYFYVWTT